MFDTHGQFNGVIVSQRANQQEIDDKDLYQMFGDNQECLMS